MILRRSQTTKETFFDEYFSQHDLDDQWEQLLIDESNWRTRRFLKICGPPFYKPDKDKGIKCYVNSDVACRWDQANDNIIEISCHYVHRLSSIMVKYVIDGYCFK